MQKIGPVLADPLLQIGDAAGQFSPLIPQGSDDMWFGHNPYPLEKMGLSSSCQRYLASCSWWRLLHKTEQAAVVADQGGIGPIGLVAAQLGATEVLDLGRINDTDAVSGIMEMKRQAVAVASSCLQAGMHLVNAEILQPAKQRLPAFS